MSDFTDGAAPAGTPSDSGTPAAAQPIAATTTVQTDGTGGGEPSPAARTFTQDELNDILRKEKAKTEAKTERRVLRTLERFIPQQQAHGPQPAQAAAASDDGKPTRAQFASEDEWLDARDSWRDRQRETQQAQQRQQESTRTLAQKTDAVYAQAQKLPGFDRESFDELPLTRSIVEALLEADAPDKLMHFLAANPDEVERISKLSETRQKAEMGKLEAKASEQKPPARSNAPTALAPAKGSAPAGMPDPSNTKAYIKWANEQERGSR